MEEKIYKVLSPPSKDILVFEVQQEDGTGRKKMLHRNLLLPIGFLPTADKTDQIEEDDQEKSETEASVNYSDSDSEN